METKLATDDVTQDSALTVRSVSPIFVSLLLAVHVPIGIIAFIVPQFASLHAIATVMIGLAWAALGRNVSRVAYVAGYIAGAEVLWRMTYARVYWEFGKYAVVVILGIALLRFFRKWRQCGLPLLYLVLLIPSTVLTLHELGLTEIARKEISFNLSGPVSLAVCAVFFAQTRASKAELSNILWSLVFPIVSIATIALYNTLTADNLFFTLQSNFVTSGGFGPNQVSAVMGLGATAALLVFLMDSRGTFRCMALALILWLLAQSMLTFSRAGVFNAIIVILFTLVHAFTRRRLRRALTVALMIILLIGGYLIIPRLDAFTGGMLLLRFTDLDSTHRVEIIQGDIDTWKAHPVLGVGPGMAKRYRQFSIRLYAAAHTEFSRLVAEHGIAGFFALLVLLITLWRTYKSAPPPAARMWVAATGAWAIAEMTHSAMRIVAIGFVFGLALIHWVDQSAIKTASEEE